MSIHTVGASVNLGKSENHSSPIQAVGGTVEIESEDDFPIEWVGAAVDLSGKARSLRSPDGSLTSSISSDSSNASSDVSDDEDDDDIFRVGGTSDIRRD